MLAQSNRIRFACWRTAAQIYKYFGLLCVATLADVLLTWVLTQAAWVFTPTWVPTPYRLVPLLLLEQLPERYQDKWFSVEPFSFLGYSGEYFDEYRWIIWYLLGFVYRFQATGLALSLARTGSFYCPWNTIQVVTALFCDVVSCAAVTASTQYFSWWGGAAVSVWLRLLLFSAIDVSQALADEDEFEDEKGEIVQDEYSKSEILETNAGRTNAAAFSQPLSLQNMVQGGLFSRGLSASVSAASSSTARQFGSKSDSNSPQFGLNIQSTSNPSLPVRLESTATSLTLLTNDDESETNLAGQDNSNASETNLRENDVRANSPRDSADVDPSTGVEVVSEGAGSSEQEVPERLSDFALPLAPGSEPSNSPSQTFMSPPRIAPSPMASSRFESANGSYPRGSFQSPSQSESPEAVRRRVVSPGAASSLIDSSGIYDGIPVSLTSDSSTSDVSPNSSSDSTPMNSTNPPQQSHGDVVSAFSRCLQVSKKTFVYIALLEVLWWYSFRICKAGLLTSTSLTNLCVWEFVGAFLDAVRFLLFANVYVTFVTDFDCSTIDAKERLPV